MPEHVDHIEFRLEQGRASAPQAPRIPAQVLAEVLLHAQQVVYLLALDAKGHEVRLRLRVPADIKEAFALQCELPEAGSYVQPVSLRAEDGLLHESMAAGPRVLGTFASLAKWIESGSWHEVQGAVRDSTIRRRVIEEFAAMIPAPEETWTLGLQNGEGEFAFFDAEVARSLREHIRSLRAPQEAASEPVTLAGELTKIDFAERKFTIRHFPSKRALDCEYNEELEETLVTNRRGLIQVTGLVELNEKDEPIRLTSVFEVREVDTSDMVMAAIPVAGGVLRFRSGPRAFKVDVSESGTLLVVEDDELGVHAYAATREELRGILEEEFDVVWGEYARADPGTLTPAAARLGERLREVFEFIPGASEADA